MGSTQVTGLAAARLEGTCGHHGPSLASSTVAAVAATMQVAADRAGTAMPGATFASKWYPNPERLMSQSERLPS
jgi:hypothetical protein